MRSIHGVAESQDLPETLELGNQPTQGQFNQSAQNRLSNALQTSVAIYLSDRDQTHATDPVKTEGIIRLSLANLKVAYEFYQLGLSLL